MQGASVKFYRYLNTTANFTYIGGFVTDGNGEGSIDLFPFRLYMIKIHYPGYTNATEFWSPSIEEQLLVKTFKIYIATSPAPAKEYDDYVTFYGNLDNSTGIIHVNYTDTLAGTLDWQLIIYRLNIDGTSTIIATRSGTNSSFTVSETGVNTNDYHIVLHVNHSSFGYVIDDFFLLGYNPHEHGKAAKLNLLMTLNFGYNPFGWANTVMLVLCFGIFFSFGRRETYLSIMLLGVSSLFLNLYIGFPTFINGLFAGMFPVLLIFIGILMLVRDRGYFGAS
jgi:hypothetical protein